MTPLLDAVTDRSAAFERFMASTDIDYDRWHDGVPYDLDAVRELEGDERAEAETWLLVRAKEDWRDLEGLLALGTDRGRSAVVAQLRSGTIQQRLAAARRLPPNPEVEADRERAVLDGLRTAEFVTGLRTVLDLALAKPSGAVIEGLLDAALRRESGVHAAAALVFLHGQANEAFDWDQRPFFLRFGETDAEREAAFRELSLVCKVDPEPYLRAWRERGRT
jgi:hypothetical protein